MPKSAVFCLPGRENPIRIKAVMGFAFLTGLFRPPFWRAGRARLLIFAGLWAVCLPLSSLTAAESSPQGKAKNKIKASAGPAPAPPKKAKNARSAAKTAKAAEKAKAGTGKTKPKTGAASGQAKAAEKPKAAAPAKGKAKADPKKKAKAAKAKSKAAAKAPPKPEKAAKPAKSPSRESEKKKAAKPEGQKAAEPPAPQLLPKNARAALKGFLKMFLDKKSPSSERYNQTVELLEASVYNKASFETLKILAETYEENKDHPNQIKVLNQLALAHPDRPEAHYLLGMAHKADYLEAKKKAAEKKDIDEDEEKFEEEIEKAKARRERAVDSFSEAIKKNRKYAAAYEELFPLIIEEGHTKFSLSLAAEMIRYIKKPEYFIFLCEAYFENEFFQQSRKACKKSLSKNPKDPKSLVLLALSQTKKTKRKAKAIEAADNFPDSYYVQRKVGDFFLNEESPLAFSYLDTAARLKPGDLKLHAFLARKFFDAEKFKKSLKHFSEACDLSKGRFLKDFRDARSRLSAKKLPKGKKRKLIQGFDKSIKSCFDKRKKEVQEKRNKARALLKSRQKAGIGRLSQSFLDAGLI